MRTLTGRTRWGVALIGVLATGCGDDTQSPLAVMADGPGTHAQHMLNQTTANAVVANATPFTVRATLPPFRIDQPPEFSMRSKERADIVIQQAVFNPGAGPWHTHPGPSFVYVIDGQIKLERVTKEGCMETPVHGPGQAYYEIADQVHRAVVVSQTPAVLLVTRFNIPVGAPVTTPAADPGC